MYLEVEGRTPGTRAGEADLPHLLCVHGGGQAAWAWENFLPWLARQGFGASALSLRGHGKSEGGAHLKWLSLRDYVADVAQVIRSEVPSGRPVVLVGHSMGGAVLQEYLSALACRAGLPRPAGVVLISTTTASGWRQVIRTQALGGVGRAIAHRDARLLTMTPERVRKDFFTSLTPQQTVGNFCARLQGESLRVMFWDLFRYRTSSTDVPVQVMGSEDDRIVPPAALERVATAYGGAPLRLFQGMGHELMLDVGWQDVAQAIAEFATRFLLANP